MNIKRNILFLWQRKTRGWDDSELWSLDHIIAKFVLPRLVRFKKIHIGHPSSISPEEWERILDEMIWFFEIHANEPWLFGGNPNESKRYKEAGKLIGEYFGNLWD